MPRRNRPTPRLRYVEVPGPAAAPGKRHAPRTGDDVGPGSPRTVAEMARLRAAVREVIAPAPTPTLSRSVVRFTTQSRGWRGSTPLAR